MTKKAKAEKKRPVIFTVLPEEIKDGYPHGQFLFDVPGLAINFATELDDEVDYLPNLEPMREKLAEFLAGDEPFLAFESPHTGGINYLTRHGAEKIIAIDPAWSRKVLARTRSNGTGAQIVDSGSGLPILRKLQN